MLEVRLRYIRTIVIALCLAMLIPWPRTLQADAPASHMQSEDRSPEDKSPVITIYPVTTNEVLHNPFIGMAPPAPNGPYPNPHRLAYAVLSWRELEPEQGQYAFEEIESRYQFAEWNAEDVKLILRIVADYGDDQGGLDIPDWLYEELDGKGVWYDEDVGNGFSPNYSDPRLIHRHQQLMAALGERYNDDPRIAFIALGSLGHWGEWHTYSDDNIDIPFPPLPISDQYVEHYLAAFPDKHLLMRRPHPIAKQKNLGLYNDMFGSHEATNENYLQWIKNGYTSALADSEMPPMPEFWLTSPSGGEFANANQVRSYFSDEGIEAVLEQARNSHISWLGPSNPTGLHLSDAEQKNLDSFLNTIGYRFAVRSVSYKKTASIGSPFTLSIVIENQGVAPFYYRWPIELSLINAAGEVVLKQQVQEDIRRWLPGLIRTVQQVDIPDHLAAGAYSLAIAILDEQTMQPGVDFAMEGKRTDGRYKLGDVTVLPRISSK